MKGELIVSELTTGCEGPDGHAHLELLEEPIPDKRIHLRCASKVNPVPSTATSRFHNRKVLGGFMSRSLRRLQKELKDMQAIPQSQYTVQLVGNDINTWKVVLLGPKGTPYEGGKFVLDVKFPKEYPFLAPEIRFATKIYHPNVYASGLICLDLLRRDELTTWSEAQSMSKVFLTILGLVARPNPKSPTEQKIGTLFETDRPTFDRTARLWTQKYAK